MSASREVHQDPELGQEWLYRLRDDAPSERVRVLSVHRKGQKFRVVVLYLDGAAAGTKENVPRSRLRVPWNEAAEYDAAMEAWNRLSAETIDRNESSALWTVLELLIPDDVAELYLAPVDDALVVHDEEALETLTDLRISALLRDRAWTKYDGKPCLSPLASLTVAEMACRKRPGPVLEWIMAEEAQAREKSKRGWQREDYSTRQTVDTSPEYEYSYYLRSDKPKHELLRQWCGYRAVTAHERLVAAEAEVARLNILLAQAVDHLREYTKISADIIESDHEKERITPQSIRPVPQRPLDLNEAPVVQVPIRRYWSR